MILSSTCVPNRSYVAAWRSNTVADVGTRYITQIYDPSATTLVIHPATFMVLGVNGSRITAPLAASVKYSDGIPVIRLIQVLQVVSVSVAPSGWAMTAAVARAL